MDFLHTIWIMQPSHKKIIICGDLFDRGEETEELQQYILELMEKDEVILIRGNHEDLFCDLVTTDRGLALGHHVHNGTFQTALDLTGYDTVMAGIRHFDFAEAGRKTPYYSRIIPTMLDYYETPHYIFVHGWYAAGRGVIVEGKTVVCGHWHCSYGHSSIEGKCSEFGPDADFTPYYAPGIIALDACTAHSGRVNVIVSGWVHCCE